MQRQQQKKLSRAFKYLTLDTCPTTYKKNQGIKTFMVGKIKTNSVLPFTICSSAFLKSSGKGVEKRENVVVPVSRESSGLNWPCVTHCSHSQTPKLEDFSKQKQYSSLTAQNRQSPALFSGQINQLHQPLSQDPCRTDFQQRADNAP